LKPDDKLQLVKDFEEEAGAIMIGDGVNDAPSLAQATIGMAMSSGGDIASSASDVVIVSNKLTDITKFLRLTQMANKKMRENLWWGAGYNIIAIPLAAGLLLPIGITITPAVSAIVMSLSTIIVAVNAMSLK
jgi:Cu2+-exporting ATPase